jgi:hypothetical protein
MDGVRLLEEPFHWNLGSTDTFPYYWISLMTQTLQSNFDWNYKSESLFCYRVAIIMFAYKFDVDTDDRQKRET